MGYQSLPARVSGHQRGGRVTHAPLMNGLYLGSLGTIAART